jgi:hypothetical protein
VAFVGDAIKVVGLERKIRSEGRWEKGPVKFQLFRTSLGGSVWKRLASTQELNTTGFITRQSLLAVIAHLQPRPPDLNLAAVLKILKGRAVRVFGNVLLNP